MKKRIISLGLVVALAVSATAPISAGWFDWFTNPIRQKVTEHKIKNVLKDGENTFLKFINNAGPMEQVFLLGGLSIAAFFLLRAAAGKADGAADNNGAKTTGILALALGALGLFIEPTTLKKHFDTAVDDGVTEVQKDDDLSRLATGAGIAQKSWAAWNEAETKREETRLKNQPTLEQQEKDLKKQEQDIKTLEAEIKRNEASLKNQQLEETRKQEKAAKLTAKQAELNKKKADLDKKKKELEKNKNK